VRVVNMSFGYNYGGCLAEQADPPERSEEWRVEWNKLLQEFNEDASDGKGVLLVQAAGNDCRPVTGSIAEADVSGLPNGLLVASVDQRGQLAWSSSFSEGGSVPVAAGGTWTKSQNEPGSGVWAATHENFFSGNTTTVPVAGTGPIEVAEGLPGASTAAPNSPQYAGSTSTWGTKAGTSMAAPAVAGVAALVASANPELTAPEIKDCIVDGARHGTSGVPDSGRNPREPQFKEALDQPGDDGKFVERKDFPSEDQLNETYIVDALASVHCARQRPGAVNPLRPVTDVQEDSAVVMVLDVSGSMSGDRIAAAKAAVNEQVRSVEPGTLVGVRIYPFGDETEPGTNCSTGYPLVGVAPNDPTSTSAIVRRLRAGGDTPTAPAMRAAAADLEALGVRSATIVLVSDGESNCGGDPCEAARELAQSGIFTIPTIGFQISEAGRAELECIADATGGTYADADDSDQLSEQAARLSNPDLQLAVQAPEAMAAGGTVTITAEIASQGGATARDVQLELLVERDAVTRLDSPRRRVGNLTPGSSASATWVLRTPLELVDRTLDYEVRVTADNLPNVERSLAQNFTSGSVQVAGDLDVTNLGGPLEGTSRVALLGDGFSSGEGTGTYLPGSDTADNACHRGPATYGAALWDDRVLLACSGALIADLTTDPGNRLDEPAQLRRLADEDPVDAALLTVGATDVGLVELLRYCAGVDDCTRAEAAVSCPDDHVCERIAEQAITDRYVDRAAGLAPRLADAYRAVDATINQESQIEARGGDTAPVIVVAYPKVIPPSSGGSARCDALFTTDELALAGTVIDSINASAAAAVDELRSEGLPVYFAAGTSDAIDPDRALCARSEDTAIAGLDSLLEDEPAPMGDLTIPTHTPVDLRARNEQFHPNQTGHRALTAALVDWSNSAGLAPPPPEGLDSRRPIFSGSATGGDAIDLVRSGRAEVKAGSTYEVTAEGFAPNSTVSARLLGNDTVLGVAITDESGTASVTARIPESAAPGDEVLAVTGFGAEGAPLLRTRPAEVVPPVPWWIWGLLGLGVAAVVAATVLTLLARRHRTVGQRASEDTSIAAQP
jgi:subtilisin family serine protease